MAGIPQTFAQALSKALAGEPGRPLITYYDDASGERTELSVTTYANWVAKAASLLADENDLELGDRLRLDLPGHWMGPVFAGAAWTVGLTLTDEDDPDAVVCGPDAVDRWAGSATDILVLACALLPMGVRFADPMPDGVLDVGVEIWSQPDAFVAVEEPSPETVAVAPDVTQRMMCEAAAAGSELTDGGRLLAAVDPASPPMSTAFVEPLVKGGSLVLVAHADEKRLASIAADERATARADR